MSVSQADKAQKFRALHEAPGAFVIANPWDAGSARMLAGLGFPALATSSGAKAGVFLVTFAVTALMIWSNARLALHFTRHRRTAAGFNWKPAATATHPSRA